MSGVRVSVYIDETGDRGSGPAASPIFGMAAVLVDDGGADALRQAVQQLRSDFGVSAHQVMSWKNHVKTHDRRRRAADVLAAVDGMQVCYVYAQKSELRRGTYRDFPDRFYNYITFTMYKNVLWAARNWKGQQSRVWTRFGHVRHHDHQATEEYIRRSARCDRRVPDHLEQGLRWVSSDQYAESQAADLFGGFLKSALWPTGPFGYVEPAYLLTIWHKIRCSDQCGSPKPLNCAVPLGLMSLPDKVLVTRQPWFPCLQCPQRTSESPT